MEDDGMAPSVASDLVKVLIALGIGSLIGLEREYRSKAAGFRTMTLICMGSSVFTILSVRVGADGTPDRIVSNIITGIGFLGAGVIFKDGMSISGLTTATSIWMTAALGMAAGAGELGLAAIGLVLTLVVLSLFQRFQDMIDALRQKRSYRLQFAIGQLSLPELEAAMQEFGVRFEPRRVVRRHETMSCWYDVWGTSAALRKFSDFLMNHTGLLSVEY
jgi:putative Mg2+ transporter-C (MgtC) family protein